MRALDGRGTLKELVDAARKAILFVVQADVVIAIAIIAEFHSAPALFIVVLALEPD